MRGRLAVFVSLVLAAFMAGCGADPATSAGGKPYQIGITQYVEHPALDASYAGFLDGLKAAGLVEGTDFVLDFQNSQNDRSVALQIAQKFVADKKDLIYAISTPSSVGAMTAAEGKIPIVFCAVTDPLGAGLVESWQSPGGNITGISDLSPVADQLALFGQLGVPIKTVGMIYNAGEPNSVFMAEEARAAAPGLGLTLVEATVANPNEVIQAAQTLVGQVDGFYLMADNTIAQAAQAVVDVANEHKKPTVGADFSEQGVLIRLGAHYHDLGVKAGKVAAEILRGKQPSEIPVQMADAFELVIHPDSLAAVGLSLPKELLDQAILFEADE